MTEASCIVTVNPPTIDDYTGAIGLPLPSTDIAIRDAEGRDLPIGEAGELFAPSMAAWPRSRNTRPKGSVADVVGYIAARV